MTAPYGFREFRVGDLFTIEKISSHDKKDLNLQDPEQNYDYITRTSLDRGICSTTGYISDVGLNEAGSYSLGLLQMDFFYRNRPWYAGQFMRKIVCKYTISVPVALYFETILNKLSNILKSVLVRDVDNVFLSANIELPVTPSGTPDFDYMTTYIAGLETEYIAGLETKYITELETYLKVAGLDNYELTESDRDVLSRMSDGNVLMGEFHIGDFFEKLELKNKKAFNKRTDTSPVKTQEYNIPLINAKHGDNGIMFYGKSEDCEAASGTIGIVQNGAIATGDVYPHPEETGVLWDAYLIKPNIEMSPELLIYFSCAIQKSIKNQYSYDNKCYWDKVQNDVVVIPVMDDGVPDYTFMEQYIWAIKKQTIAKLNEQHTLEVGTVKEVID